MVVPPMGNLLGRRGGQTSKLK